MKDNRNEQMLTGLETWNMKPEILMSTPCSLQRRTPGTSSCLKLYILKLKHKK